MPNLKRLDPGEKTKLIAIVSNTNVKKLVNAGADGAEDFSKLFQSIEWRNIQSDCDVLCAFASIFAYIAKLRTPALVSTANRVLQKRTLVNQIPQTLPRLLCNGRGDVIERQFRRNTAFQSVMASVVGDKDNADFWERLKKIKLNKIDEEKDNILTETLETIFQQDVDEIPASDYSADDMKFAPQGGEKLNNIHKALLSYYLQESHGFGQAPSFMDSYKSIFDFDKNDIATLKRQLPDATRPLTADFINSDLEFFFDYYDVHLDMASDEQKKVSLGIVKIAIADIRKMVQNYEETLGELKELRVGEGKELKKFESIRSNDLENSQDAIQKILKRFEQLAKSQDLEEFEELAQMYGCATDRHGNLSMGFRQFNEFLRNRHFKKASPAQYAYMFNRIDALRKGLLKNSKSLNDKEFTLYRYTSLDGVFGMLRDSMLVDKTWEKRVEDKFNKQHDEIVRKLDELKKIIGLSDKSDLERAVKYNEVTDQIAKISERIAWFTNSYTKELGEDGVKTELKNSGILERIEELKQEQEELAKILNSKGLKVGDGLDEKTKQTITQYEKLARSERKLNTKSAFFEYSKPFKKEQAKKIEEVLSTQPVIHDRGFLSTSADETATEGFGECKLVITCKPGMVKAADISKLSGHRGQEEHLFVPNQLFKVTKYTLERKWASPCFTIYMDTVKSKKTEEPKS